MAWEKYKDGESPLTLSRWIHGTWRTNAIVPSTGRVPHFSRVSRTEEVPPFGQKTCGDIFASRKARCRASRTCQSPGWDWINFSAQSYHGMVSWSWRSAFAPGFRSRCVVLHVYEHFLFDGFHCTLCGVDVSRVS